MSKNNRKNSEKGSYTEYFVTTTSPKLKKRVNIKKLLDEEIKERHPDLVKIKE
jgi:hypothetical protein